MSVIGLEMGPQDSHWVEMVKVKTNDVLAHPNALVIPAILNERYGIKPESLPLQVAADTLIHLKRLQKFRHQDTAIQVLPSQDGFAIGGTSNFGGDVNIFDSGASHPFELPPNINQGDQMDVRWQAWFAGLGKAFWGARSEASTIGLESMRAPFILGGIIPEKNKIAMLVPALNLFEFRYPDRAHGATVIIDLDSNKALKRFCEDIKSNGSNLLNALFGELLNPSLSPTITKFQTTNYPAAREQIFAAKPTSQVFLHETNWAENRQTTSMVNILEQARRERGNSRKLRD